MSRKSKILSNAELSAFCQQISLIIAAGLPTYYGVSILCDEAPDEQTHNLLEQIYKPMELGATLHSALKNTGYFPKYMINMIQLGEDTLREKVPYENCSFHVNRIQPLCKLHVFSTLKRT